MFMLVLSGVKELKEESKQTRDELKEKFEQTRDGLKGELEQTNEELRQAKIELELVKNRLQDAEKGASEMPAATGVSRGEVYAGFKKTANRVEEIKDQLLFEPGSMHKTTVPKWRYVEPLSHAAQMKAQEVFAQPLLLETILQPLEPVQLVTISQISKAFREFVAKRPKLQRSIHLLPDLRIEITPMGRFPGGFTIADKHFELGGGITLGFLFQGMEKFSNRHLASCSDPDCDFRRPDGDVYAWLGDHMQATEVSGGGEADAQPNKKQKTRHRP
ncbi:hypothetical protein H2203_005953 [Taxawa tesnikishii (nom. ined.)]|nr:hypothetical protein H2203_005953 [Dothideales sp. JES 119]